MTSPYYRIRIPAGPIWSEKDAEVKGKIIAAARGGRYTGESSMKIPSAMSVVEVEFDVPNDTATETFVLDVPAGPIEDDADAMLKGPVVCASYGGIYNGTWKTIIEGKMSVCGCVFKC